MKALFIHFYDFSPHSGISKKIIAQMDALRMCRMEVELCYMKIDERGNQLRIAGEKVISNYGRGPLASIIKWFDFEPITEYILSNKIDFVYIRSFYNTNPQLLRLIRKSRESGAAVVLEIPTYPYDNEVKSSPLKHRFIFFINRLFRMRLGRYLNAIVTFSDYDTIHGVKTIKISNGIDFNSIRVKRRGSYNPKELRMVGVADIRFWHGFDRVIEGMANYYSKYGIENAPVKVTFDIVGDGVREDVDKLRELIKTRRLGSVVKLLGNKSGEDLSDIFDNSDFGIASLGRHRSGITKIRTLKNREYAARGIPFIYSETDEDFDHMPYVMKAKADDSPVNIEDLIEFYQSLESTPEQIRGSIENTLSWRVQMQKVIDAVL